MQVVEKFVLQLEAQLMDRNVTIELTPAAAAWLADKGYDDKMGARPLARVIQEHIKKPLAEELLFGKLTKGGLVRVDLKDDARGAVLGQVGLSGRSEFPHLHLTVRRGTEVIDPFLPDPDAACGTPVEHTLWLSPIDYVPGGLIALGFSDEVPDYQTVRAGLESRDAMGRQAPAMVLWGYAFGARAGDEIAMRITGPEGVVAETAETLDREQAQFYRAAGRRLTRTEGWPPGIYRGEVRISRDGAPYSEAQATLHISR
jgi:hypothetical protein